MNVTKIMLLFIAILVGIASKETSFSSQIVYGRATINETATHIEFRPQSDGTSGKEGHPVETVSESNESKSSTDNLVDKHSIPTTTDINSPSSQKNTPNDANSAKNSEPSSRSSSSSKSRKTEVESLVFTPNSTASFGDCFPGKIAKTPIIVKSNYSKTVKIISVSSSDVRFIGYITNTTISPNKAVEIGYVLLDPARGPELNYMNYVTVNSEKVSITEPLSKTDLLLLKKRELLWNQLRQVSANKLNAAITLTTDSQTEYTLNVKANLIRPTLVNENGVDFSLVQVGQIIHKPVKVHNPSDFPIHIHVLPLLQDEASPFQLVMAHADRIQIIPPHSSKDVALIKFTPTEYYEFTTTLYIKNNLTVLDAVKIRGQGGYGRFVFTKGDTTILENLRFEISSEDLRVCKKTF